MHRVSEAYILVRVANSGRTKMLTTVYRAMQTYDQAGSFTQLHHDVFESKRFRSRMNLCSDLWCIDKTRQQSGPNVRFSRSLCTALSMNVVCDNKLNKRARLTVAYDILRHEIESLETGASCKGHAVESLIES